MDEFYDREGKLRDEDNKIEQSIKELKGNVDILKNGVLSIQGRGFKHDCRVLLEEGHSITLTEYENLATEHKTYNSLGGNSHGDALFELVKIKYQAQIGHPVETEENLLRD